MPKVGIQLIIYGGKLREDPLGVLREVKEIGYDGVETGNLARQFPLDQVKDWFSSLNLNLTGIHAGFEEIRDPHRLEEDLQFLKAMNACYLMCSGVGDRALGLGAYDAAAEVFNQVGFQCKEAGVHFCYHNHNWEFERFNGTKGIHRLAERTDPEVVKLCVDVYWVQVGGEDPVEFIQRYKDRAIYFHIKDGRPGQFTELGRGEVNLKASLELIRQLGAEWIVYEQDRTDLTPGESSRISREYLRSLGF